MFVDQVKVHIKAGRGGDGIVSFRHEKYVAYGGLLVAMVVMVESYF